MTGRDEFSVAQFFEDGSYEYVRRYVSGDNAMQTFKHYSRSIATLRHAPHRFASQRNG